MKAKPLKKIREKEKMKEDEMADIKQQKLSLERSIKSMQVVDNYLTRAEEKNDISCLVKANAFKPFGKRKTQLKSWKRRLKNWNAS